jgi:hypothetical protein
MSGDAAFTPSLSPRQTNKLLWALLAGFAVLSFFLLAYPVYVIRPFRHQNAAELALALAVMRFRPLVQILLAVASICLLVKLWGRIAGVWVRVLASACALFVIGFPVLSRINIYELMFHPMEHPSFLLASNSKLSGDEQVITVHAGGRARAYPIRSMSYHHIVNDTVGGLPIVATY